MRHHVVSYMKVVDFLLEKYTSNETINQTQDWIKKLQQPPNQRASDFANYILSRTNHCGSAYRQINKIEIFIHGIAHQIREQTTGYWSDHPDIDLQSLDRFANGPQYAISPKLERQQFKFQSRILHQQLQIYTHDTTSSIRAETFVLSMYHNEKSAPHLVNKRTTNVTIAAVHPLPNTNNISLIRVRSLLIPTSLQPESYAKALSTSPANVPKYPNRFDEPF